MNNQLSIIIFWILALSCKAPVSSFYQGNVTLVSAEKSEWFGGRPGVRGTMYTAVLKLKNSKDRITVISFKAEGNTVSFTQSVSGNTITVKGNFQKQDEINTIEYSPSGSTVVKSEIKTSLNPKENWIEYTVKDSKKIYKINIPKFTLVEPEGELIPRRQ
ncbi:hypothetical protein [Chryseobacterium gambrini]|uniref:hypothetical protein n=1 Tax=Chryseobacterium gambrini TaxID=373672 RepID=UPI0022F3A315|nr:hypothetical protein [Chryseobacterium gambrini]WBX99013.1 hypothetical protein PE065_07055 [Chryseobacterium gambrini]